MHLCLLSQDVLLDTKPGDLLTRIGTIHLFRTKLQLPEYRDAETFSIKNPTSRLLSTKYDALPFQFHFEKKFNALALMTHLCMAQDLVFCARLGSVEWDSEAWLWKVARYHFGSRIPPAGGAVSGDERKTRRLNGRLRSRRFYKSVFCPPGICRRFECSSWKIEPH